MSQTERLLLHWVTVKPFAEAPEEAFCCEKGRSFFRELSEETAGHRFLIDPSKTYHATCRRCGRDEQLVDLHTVESSVDVDKGKSVTATILRKVGNLPPLLLEIDEAPAGEMLVLARVSSSA